MITKILKLIFLCLFTLGQTMAALSFDAQAILQQLQNNGYTTSQAINELRSRGYTVQDLKNAGVTVQDLKGSGVTLQELKSAGVSIAELQAAGVTVQELKDAGFTIAEFQAAGVTLVDLKTSGYSLNDFLNAGVSVGELKQLGYSVNEFKAAGVSVGALKTAGFSLQELKNAGFNASELITAGYSANELKTVGFSLQDLKNSGVSASQLKTSGYTALELEQVGFGLAELKSAGFSVNDLIAAGKSPIELKNAGYSLSDFKTSSVSINDLKNLGFTANEFKTAGYSASELKGAGFSAAQLKSSGYSLDHLMAANFSTADLKTAGFSANELRSKGLSAGGLKNAGFTSEELLAAGFSQSEVIQAGDSVREVINSGVSIEQILLENRFSVQDLVDAGIPASELKAAGLPVNDLIRAGIPVSELKAAGYTLNQFQSAGVSAKDLVEAGFSISQLQSAGFSVSDLMASGASVKSLLDSGMSARELSQQGVSWSELKTAGATANDLKAAGATLADLRSAGFDIRDLVAAGYSAQELMGVGYHVQDLANAGMGPADLKRAGVSNKDLKAAGIEASDLKGLGISLSDLKEAGYTLRELKEAGYNSRELKGVGYSAREQIAEGFETQALVTAGYSAKELFDAGVTVDQLLSAGFTEQQLADAGIQLQDQAPPPPPVAENPPKNNDGRNPADDGGGLGDIIGDLVNSSDMLDDQQACIDKSSSDPKAQDCRSQQMRWSCKYNVCYSEATREEAIGQGSDCYKNNSHKNEINSCVTNVENNFVLKIASGSECKSTSERAKACQAEGKIWNCNVNQCLSPSANQELASGVATCYRGASDQIDGCLAKLETDLTEKVVQDELNSCVEGNQEAQSCNALSDKVWNCVIGQCLPKDYNSEIVGKGKACQSKSSDSEVNSCILDLERTVAEEIVKGKLCDQSSAKAKECSASGKFYNCDFNQCITQKHVDLFLDDAIACQKISDSTEKEKCEKQLKSDVIAYEASGASCNQSTKDANDCQKEGKIWNCNVKMCLSESENKHLTDKVVECQSHDIQAQKEQCMNGLADAFIEHKIYACHEAGGPQVTECAAKGRKYNCELDMCLTENDNQRIVNAAKECLEIENKKKQEECITEIGMFKLVEEKQKEFDPEKAFNLPDGLGKVKAGYAMTAALGAISMFGGCISGGINAAAGAMAAANESSSNKRAQQMMDALRAEYEALEAKKAQEGVSYEIQLEAFEFYIKSLRAGEEIADFKASGYASNKTMFGAGMAMGAVDIMIGSMSVPPKVPMIICGGANIGIGGLGMGLSGKLQGMAEDLAADFREQRQVLEEIRDAFIKKFGNDGKLGSSMNIAGHAPGAGGGSSQKGLPINPTSAGTVNFSGANGLNRGATADESEDIAALGSNVTSCADRKGRLDSNCHCKKTNSCLQVPTQFNNIGPFGEKVTQAADTNSILSDANNILSGRLNAAQLDQAALKKRAKKVAEVAKRALDFTNNKVLPKINRAPINEVTDKDINNFVNKKLKDGTIKGNGDFLGLNMGAFPADDGLAVSKSLGKRKKAAKKLAALIPGSKKDFFDFRNELQGIELDELEEEEDKIGRSIASTGIPIDADGLDYNKNDIYKDTSLSLFKIISNRYNILRLERRFGSR